MSIGSLQFSEADHRYVADCLGRAPHAVVGVASRDAQGRPAVIINLPLIAEGEGFAAFPTLYWLVDPELCRAIADAERTGGIETIDKALADDPELMRAHLADNRWYARARWAVLNEDEKAVAQQHGLREVLETSGVGGVANHAALKCLHAQYAFHLARPDTGSTVGRLMKRELGIKPV